MVVPRIRLYRPTERLQPYISSYSIADVEAGEPYEVCLLPSWAHIRIIVSGWATARLCSSEQSSVDTPMPLFGPTSHTCAITAFPPTHAIGVALLPLGWAHLIGQPASRFADRIGNAQEIFPGDADRLFKGLRDAGDDEAARSILDEFFSKVDALRPQPTPTIVRAHEVLLDETIVTADQFARALELSNRHMARLSLEMFGFTPKLLLRRQRFLRTLDRMLANPDKPWVMQIDDAYADQPHFVRDFHRFVDMSPTEYFMSQRHFIDVLTRLRRQAIGNPLVGLHPPKSPGNS
jgi:AraC-like DNA-binding protein